MSGSEEDAKGGRADGMKGTPPARAAEESAHRAAGDSVHTVAAGRPPRRRVVTHRRGHRRGLLDYEHMHEPLISPRQFIGRLARSSLTAFILIGGSLLLGVLGYHIVSGLGWMDSLLNASMILTGMGPVDRMTTDASKLFASLYALFSGVMFLTSVGLLLAPVVHRFLHRFHLESEEGSE